MTAAIMSSVLLAFLPVSAFAEQTGPSQLAVASVAIEETKLDAVNVIGWGKPSEKDARTIREALGKEIASSAGKTQSAQGNPLKIWVVVRRYQVATSNNASAALASVAWCAAYDAEHIVFHEEFYAATHSNLTFPKGRVNKAIALRIAASARQLASLGEGAELQPVVVKDTFVRYDDAQKRAGMVFSVDPGGSVHGDGYAIHYGGGITGQSGGWDWAQHPDRINWKEYIARASAAGN